jgi:hypothetical protein
MLRLQHGPRARPYLVRDCRARTARLVLRQFRAEDLEPLLGFNGDADVVRYVPYTRRVTVRR